MANLIEIVNFLNEFLDVDRYADYCPNGLQIEGKDNVNKIISGVTASQMFIDGAIEQGADLVLVHHGFFWRGDSQAITGIKKNRIKKLLDNNTSLLAYHLPLDGHKTLGNNAQLAEKLGVNIERWFGPEGKDICVLGRLSKPLIGDAFSRYISSALGRDPLHICADKNKMISTIAICTGGAQNYFETAIAQNVDAYLTGEVSEQCFHLAHETGVDFFAAGHHATERYGVQALGKILEEKFAIKHKFLDIDNPV